MRVALYSRVSTRDRGQATSNQLHQTRELCLAQGWLIVQEYKDHESSRPDRPQFLQMMRDATAREFDLLLFWSLDRFTPEGTLATLKYLASLENMGVRWRSLTEPWIDNAGPFRDVVISLLASLAKQEKTRISERIRVGLERARSGGTKSGRPIGRPRVALRRDQVLELRSQGHSWQQIARLTSVSASSVRRAYASATETSDPCQNL